MLCQKYGIFAIKDKIKNINFLFFLSPIIITKQMKETDFL
jgi:hypothetical protein